MKTSKLAVDLLGVCVVAAGLAAPLGSAAAQFSTGGTITFTGAIVAPSYGIATSVSEKSQGFRTDVPSDRNASTVDVTFTPAPHTSTAAHVYVLVNTASGVTPPRTLTTRFVDNARRAGPQAGTRFDMGRAGGTLSIASGAVSESAVTVVVNYD
ncbi:hypothetical protein [Paraburkholderia diazotrophica]|uniref:DUF4402 domain-containing protein n=1 Tax=Paraburkholderia diazotrophica TaxID=667676 RepID=A0A1H7DU12_9BURK|nr:hypothetical protein [Paraburkholderia diazotrophica]SEK05028.1 hypothetical protein SAMN05192539_103456 [Paraburkholderia diazotrophica]